METQGRRRAARVTLRDIAVQTGYTVNTVSRALKDKPDISAPTKEKIRRCAEKMGYIGDAIAGALRSGVTKTIAVIIGDISNPHFAIMVKEIDAAARRAHYSPIVFNTDEDPVEEREAIFTALSKKVDGILICPTQRSRKNIERIRRTGLPFVLFGRCFDDIPSDYVVCDDEKGGYLATSHLIARGHRKILFLNGSTQISSAKERLAGYRRALAEAGIAYDGDLVRKVDITTGDLTSALHSLREEGVDFSAVFAFSDLVAWGAIFSLNAMGLRVPQDIAVAGFDDIQSKYYIPFPLTTIGTADATMSEKAVELLLKRMEAPEGVPEREVLDVRLIIRDST